MKTQIPMRFSETADARLATNANDRRFVGESKHLILERSPVARTCHGRCAAYDGEL